jgi:N-acylglucosamine 2-epimerase
MRKLIKIQKEIKDQLKECSDFWLTNGIDKVNGGVYTCLDRTGKIYSTDKSVWMQGRCAWTFAYLCSLYRADESWLKASESCLDFLEKYCINRENGRMYFTVTGDGKPLRQRRYFYSETFYSMANAEYYGITKKPEYLDRAKRSYNLYYDLWHGAPDTTGLGSKTIPKTRAGRSFGYPMIYLNMTLTMLKVDSENKEFYLNRAKECVDDILKYHYKPELKCLLENVGVNGEARLEFTDGRVVNPGHDIEGVWFMLEYARIVNDKKLIATCEEIFNNAFNAGWDKKYGGLLYFIDALGLPTEAYEHDMKLWWPHNETLISSIMLYRDTKNEKYLDIFYKVYKYSKKHFHDKKYGEWYGYLRRDGKPTEPSTKGSTFKGPFHLPRMLATVDKIIDELI